MYNIWLWIYIINNFVYIYMLLSFLCKGSDNSHTYFTYHSCGVVRPSHYAQTPDTILKRVCRDLLFEFVFNICYLDILILTIQKDMQKESIKCQSLHFFLI